MYTTTKVLLATTLLCTLSYAEDTTKLFDKNCAMCHDEGGIIAPPLNVIAIAVKAKYPSKEEFVAFSVNYMLDPKEEKSVFGKAAIESYGLMISQKDVMPVETLKKLTEYLYDNYGK
jgi:cytochrome c551/c552